MSVFVAGIGVISPLGVGKNENFSLLLSKQHGINSLSNKIDPLLNGFPIAQVSLSNKQLAEISGINTELPRTVLLSAIAANEAIEDSGIDITKYKSGFISATTVGGMDLTEQFFTKYIQNNNSGKLRQVINHECGKVTDIVAKIIKANTYITTINTACSSSANSIILASRLIQSGQLDIAIAGGADALTAFTLNGFNTLLLLDNELCRPFDANRKGLNLGEGSGYVLLVSEKLVAQGVCKPLCQLSGYGNTSDGFHQTALSPNGDGPYSSMKKALELANLQPEQINYINLHGTATPNNDASEGTAISRLFNNKFPALSSTKSYTGHTLGASGGIEAVFSILALLKNQTLPNLRYANPMIEVPIIPEINTSSIQINHVLSNSFGFGGNCSSLIFSKTAL